MPYQKSDRTGVGATRWVALRGTDKAPKGDPPKGDPPKGDPPKGDPPKGDPPGRPYMDIVTINEMVRLGDGFIRDNFTAREREYCEARKRSRHEHYAGRLAVKRAYLKALGCDLPLKSIEIIHKNGGVPHLKVQKPFKVKGAIKVSLAH